MRFQAVVFDLFDTLVDLHYGGTPSEQHAGRGVPPTARAVHAAVERVSEVEFGAFMDALFAVDSEYRETRYRKGLELPTEERFTTVLERLGIADEPLAQAMTEIHMAGIYDSTVVPAHHADVLGRLGGKVRLALCSNFSHSPTALRILDEADFRRHLHSVAISDAVGIRKPRGEIFAHVLQQLDVPPEAVLHVGDSLRADVGGGAEAGLATAWITRRIDDPERRLREHEGARPDFVVADLGEIESLLEDGAS
jgi:HAD superfamily hydrolase (TIGR01549 family)